MINFLRRNRTMFEYIVTEVILYDVLRHKSYDLC